MADDLITIRLKLTGGTAAAAEAKAVSAEIARTGSASAVAGRQSSLASRGVAKFRTGLIALGKAAKWAIYGGVAALGIETFRSVNAWRESREIMKETRARIKSTGMAAKVTAGDVADLAGALSLKSGVDDEVIQAGANMLLTFKNIRNEAGKGNNIFDQATESVNDLAAAMQSTPKTEAIALGKALNDPILGVTALGRKGIQFTEQQKEMIAGFVESNDLLSAQKLILKEVDSQFGGTARARSDAIDRLGVAFENLEEKAGKALFPLITDGARALTGFFTDIVRGEGIAADFSTAMGKVGPVISDVRNWISGAVGTVRSFVDELLHGSRGVGKFGQDLKAIALGIKDFGVWLHRISKGALGQLWSGVKNVFGGIAKVIGGVVKVVGGILRGDWARAWEGAKDIFFGAIQLFKGAIQTLTSPFRLAFSAIKSIVAGVVGWIVTKVEWVVQKIEDAKSKLESLNPLNNPLTSESGDIQAIVDAQVAAETGQGPTNPQGPGQAGPPRNQQPKLVTPRRGKGGQSPLVAHLHNHIYLDGEKVARNTTKHVLAAAARA